jgi:preprotein translocase subunit SecY
LSIPLAVLQAFAMLRLFEFQKIITIDSTLSLINNIIVLTAASMILVWIGELITEQKLGNGISMIIFAGIVSEIPLSIINTFIAYKTATLSQILGLIIFFVMALAMIVAIVIITEGERRVPVSYAKHVRGNKMYGGATTNLPMKVNQAGVIPIIFAMSILMLPSFIGQLLIIAKIGWVVKLGTFLVNMFNNSIIYGAVYFLLVFFFTFFYTSITFEPKEIANNLQKMGGFIPGYRHGQTTADFLQKLSSRITLFGALFLAFIAILPMILEKVTKVTTFNMGGTSILILVAVAIEIKREVEAQITMREYDY